MKRSNEYIDVNTHKTTKKKKPVRIVDNQNLPDNTRVIEQPGKFYQNLRPSDTKEIRNMANNNANDRNNNFPTSTAQTVIPAYFFQAPKGNDSNFFPSGNAYSTFGSNQVNYPLFGSNQVNYPLQNIRKDVINTLPPFNVKSTQTQSNFQKQPTNINYPPISINPTTPTYPPQLPTTEPRHVFFLGGGNQHSTFEPNQVNYPPQTQQKNSSTPISFNMKPTRYSSHSVSQMSASQTIETDKSIPINEITSKSSSPEPDHFHENKKEVENLSLLSLCSFVKGLFFCVEPGYSYKFLDLMNSLFFIDPAQARKRGDFSFNVDEYFKNAGINIENKVTPKIILENIAKYSLVDQSKRQHKWLITTEEKKTTLQIMEAHKLDKLLTEDLSNEDRKKLLKDLIGLNNQYLPERKMIIYKENAEPSIGLEPTIPDYKS